MAHSTTLYEYKTPSLGGSVVANSNLLLTFPYWGVQSLDLNSKEIVSTWHKPSNDNLQFTTPIVYLLNENKTESKWFGCGSSNNGIWLWESYERQLTESKHHIKCLCGNEFVLRMFVLSECQSWFIIVTNFGNVMLLNPNSKLFIQATNIFGNEQKSEDYSILDCKLHESLSLVSSNKNKNKNKQLCDISVMYKEKKELKMIIINVFVSHDGLLTFSKETEMKKSNLSPFCYLNEERSDFTNCQNIIVDYDWDCENEILLLISDSKLKRKIKRDDIVDIVDISNVIYCFKWINGKNLQLKWKHEMKDIASMKHDSQFYVKLMNDNKLYSRTNSNLLNKIRILLVEPRQFIVIAPSSNDGNALNLWCFSSMNASLKESMTVCSFNGLPQVLIAPLMVKFDKKNEMFNVYLCHSFGSVKIGLTFIGNSMLDMVCISLKNEITKSKYDENFGNSKWKHDLKQANWSNMNALLKNSKNSKLNENDLMFIMSVLLKLIKLKQNDAQLANVMKSAFLYPMNDIFIKRMIQLLPSGQVETMILFLINWLENDDNQIETIVRIELWLSIILDSHLGTLSFHSNHLIPSLQNVRKYVSNFETELQLMTQCQAAIHTIFDSIKHDASSNSKSATKIGATAKNNQMTFLSPKNKNQFTQQDNVPDYSIEYLRL